MKPNLWTSSPWYYDYNQKRTIMPLLTSQPTHVNQNLQNTNAYHLASCVVHQQWIAHHCGTCLSLIKRYSVNSRDTIKKAYRMTWNEVTIQAETQISTVSWACKHSIRADTNLTGRWCYGQPFACDFHWLSLFLFHHMIHHMMFRPTYSLMISHIYCDYSSITPFFPQWSLSLTQAFMPLDTIYIHFAIGRLLSLTLVDS